MQYTTNLNLKKPQRGTNADPIDVNALNDNFDVLDEVVFESSQKLIEITYSQLKTLRDNSRLIPGQQYRITDYNTIINGNVTVGGVTKTLYRSAGHQFDIIVVADSINTLNENARAVLHNGDTYFASSNLKAWELKYCLDNNTSRFSWANTSTGKGVIFYLKDDNENECYYDFKNIQMKRFKITAVDLTSRDCFNTGTINTKYQTPVISPLVGHYVGVINKVDLTVVSGDVITIDESDYKWCYTFNNTTDNYSTCSDFSFNKNNCNNNIIKRDFYKGLECQTYQTINGAMIKNNIVNSDCYSCAYEGAFYRNIIMGYSHSCISVNGFTNNRIGQDNYGNIYCGNFASNVTNAISNNNIFGASSVYNIIGGNTSDNIFVSDGWVVGNNNNHIQCGLGCDYWNVGNNNSYILAGNNCDYWTISSQNSYITAGDSCYRLTLISNNNCYLNIIDNNLKVVVMTQGSSSNIVTLPDYNGQVMVGHNYIMSTINSSTGALGTLTTYFKSHRGTIICQDQGITPQVPAGYSIETYESV